jgi:hypothetical protein
MSTSRWILSFPLLLTLGCASAPAPAPVEPATATPAPPPPATTVEVEQVTAPPPASDPPMASAPPVAVAAGPSPMQTTGARPASARAATKPAPAPAPARPAPAPAPAKPAPVPPAASGPEYTGPDPCKLAVDGDSPVDKACREAGIRGAKTAMKSLLKDARANGVRFDCDDCHINEEDYAQLSQGTDEKFAKLLAAARK